MPPRASLQGPRLVFSPHVGAGTPHSARRSQHIPLATHVVTMTGRTYMRRSAAPAFQRLAGIDVSPAALISSSFAAHRCPLRLPTCLEQVPRHTTMSNVARAPHRTAPAGADGASTRSGDVYRRDFFIWSGHTYLSTRGIQLSLRFAKRALLPSRAAARGISKPVSRS